MVLSRNDFSRKIAQVLMISFLFFLFSGKLFGKENSEQGNLTTKGHLSQSISKEFNIIKSWNNSSLFFAHIFGTTDINVNSINSFGIDDLERHIRKLCDRVNCKLVKTHATGEELSGLPKPLILVSDYKDYILVMTEIKDEEQDVYQLVKERYPPFLVKTEKEKKALSGEVWYFKFNDIKAITHKSGSMTIELNEVIHDFGIVKPSATQTTLRIKNVGKEPLTIEEPIGSCTCAVAEFEGNRILMPSQETEVKISVSFGRGNVGFRKSILFPFKRNNIKAGEFLFEVIGSCIDYGPKVIPSRLDFKEEAAAKNFYRTIKLIETPQENLGEIKLKGTADFLHPCIEEVTQLSGHRIFTIGVNIDNNKIEQGVIYKEAICVETQNPSYSDFKIPVNIEILSDIVAIPSIISMGICSKGEDVSGEIRIWNRKGGDIEISKVSAPEYYKVDINKMDDCLHLEIHAAFVENRKYNDTIKLQFDEPKGAEIIISVFAYVR